MTGTVGETLTYTSVGTTNSEGHDLEYSFQYYNSFTFLSETPWSTSLTDDHVFTETGYYYKVIVKARCIAHPEITGTSDYTSFINITAK